LNIFIVLFNILGYAGSGNGGFYQIARTFSLLTAMAPCASGGARMTVWLFDMQGSAHGQLARVAATNKKPAEAGFLLAAIPLFSVRSGEQLLQHPQGEQDCSYCGTDRGYVSDNCHFLLPRELD
jgi:hypothetical protein